MTIETLRAKMQKLVDDKFSAYTFENILQEMLDQIPDDVDKRESSVIHDALSPAAARIAQYYVELKNTLILRIPVLSNDEFLESITRETGTTRSPAVRAKRSVDFNIPVVAGTRFFVDGYNLYYTIVEGGYAECETAGEAGNYPPIGSQLIPVNRISGLTTALLGEIIIPGEEMESDDELFEEWQTANTNPAENGNKAQIEKFATDFEGVGSARAFPLWAGDNTVKVVFIDSQNLPPSPTLVEQLQEYMDPNAEGLGEGVCPLGAKVTVVGATGLTLDVAATLILAPGKSIEDAQTDIEVGLANYCNQIAFKQLVVRYNAIGDIIFNSESVIDYTDLTVNGLQDNIVIGDGEVPIAGMVALA